MSTTKNISIALFTLTNGLAFSQEIVTDRPDQTESSSTIPKGSLQIESGISLRFSENRYKSESQLSAPSTLFRYGLTKGIELRVLNQFESVRNITNSTEASGISDIEIGTKIQLYQKENVNTEIAFLSHLIIPTGSKVLTNSKAGSINKFSISHSINDKIGVGYNVGYNYFGSDSGDFTYSLVMGMKVTEEVGLYLEPYGEFVGINEYIGDFDAGITYLLKKNFQLDFSFGTGINHTMNYISAGFSWNIGEGAKK